MIRDLEQSLTIDRTTLQSIKAPVAESTSDRTTLQSIKAPVAESTIDRTTLQSIKAPVAESRIPFGDYVVVVRIAADGSFAGIKEVTKSKDFLSIEQRMNVPYIDAAKYYSESDDDDE